MCERGVTAYCVQRLFYLFLFSAFLMMTPFNGGAKEWLVPPAFEGEEFAKVREWEKTWAGKTINRSNVDQVKEFVPEGVYEVMTDSTKWGDFDFSFIVLPYKTFKPTPNMIKYTNEFSPLAKLGPDENVENYHTMAGVLFPKPKTGLEIAWNFFVWSRGDEFIRPKGQGSPVDVRTKIERGSIITEWTAYYVNRVNKPPIPYVPKNKRKIRKARFMHFDAPPHMTDFTSLHIQYIDLKKEFDGWMYWPRFRKITRIQTNVRDDVSDGLDWITDDYPDGFDDNINVNNYKLVGRKKLLLSRHTDSTTYEREQGMTMFRGIQRELINTYVVEVTYKKPNFVYQKQLWFVDPETWAILHKKIYNQQGQFWKTMGLYTDIRELYGGEVCLSEAYTMVDRIRRHGTVDISGRTDITSEWKRDSRLSIRALDRRSY